MPASLWLVPHTDNPFDKEVQELIADTIPGNFSKSLKERHKFITHVTLTSDIDPAKTFEAAGQSPQEWLDGLSLPVFRKEHDEVTLELDHVEAGDPFFRKLVIEVNQNKNLTKLAARCRRDAVLTPSADGKDGDANEQTAQKWAETEYLPHMSLMYADLPTKDVKNKLALIELQIGYGLGSLFACCGGTFCFGGNLVLVDTSKPISEWKPIAQRETPWVNWRMSRNLA